MAERFDSSLGYQEQWPRLSKRLEGAETSAEIETWLTAPWDKAKALQRPLPHHLLTVVTKPEAIAA